MKELLEKVSEKELTPLEGLEVLTDYGKRYYFKKSGWCRWDNSKQEYVISNETVGYWYKPHHLPETEITEKDFISEAIGFSDNAHKYIKTGWDVALGKECYQLAQRMVLKAVGRKEDGRSEEIETEADRVAKGLSDYKRLAEISKDQAAKMLGYDDFRDIFEVEDFDSDQKETITKIVNNALHVFSLNR